VLIGVTHDDTPAVATKMADKIWNLRVLDDADGVMNRSLADRAADGHRPQALVVSQFTLYGNTDKGRRPSWIEASRPEHAEPLVAAVVDRLSELGCVVATGRFRTEMKVELVNDGPVTLMLEL
jgi:D-tyrosyl-tRNA(Tyr) deacylase